MPLFITINGSFSIMDTETVSYFLSALNSNYVLHSAIPRDFYVLILNHENLTVMLGLVGKTMSAEAIVMQNNAGSGIRTGA